MKSRRVEFLFRAALAAILLWSAYGKSVMPPGGPTLYEAWIKAYPALKYAVPVGEALTGLWLLTGLSSRFAAIWSIVLISAFTGLLASELTKDHPKPCGCMGAIAAAYEPAAIRAELLGGIGRNILMIGCACAIYFTYARSLNGPLPEPTMEPAPSPRA